MKIGNVKLASNLILAPMAGFTDVAHRSICREFGAGLTVTEMVSVNAIFFDRTKKGTLKLLKTEPNEKPCSVQLFGNNPERFKEVLQYPEFKKFDIIDINMGCPAKKITRNKEGGFLMTDMVLAEKIIRTCVEYANRPVTVKFRIGYGTNDNNCVEFAKMCEKAGVSAITLHARTAAQGYSGTADWTKIAEVKKAIKIPVIANGDIVDLKSLEECKRITNADGFMIGRASVGKPWIFAMSDVPVDIKTLALKYIAILKKNDVYLFHEAKKHVSALMPKELKKQVITAKDEFEMFKVLSLLN